MGEDLRVRWLLGTLATSWRVQRPGRQRKATWLPGLLHADHGEWPGTGWLLSVKSHRELKQPTAYAMDSELHHSDQRGRSLPGPGALLIPRLPQVFITGASSSSQRGEGPWSLIELITEGQVHLVVSRLPLHSGAGTLQLKKVQEGGPGACVRTPGFDGF
jgi:hypothetical protein